MPDLNGGVSLLVQGAIKIPVFGHLKAHNLVLPRPWPWCCFIIAGSGLSSELSVFSGF